MSAIPNPVSKNFVSGRVVYASKNGCALNSNLQTGGGTDDTTALQTLITAANAAGGGTVVVDGVALVSTLQLGSGVTLTGLGSNTGLFQVAGTSAPLIRNSNIVSGPTAPTDSNITVRDIYLNGNRDGAGFHGNATRQRDAAGKYLPCVQMFGVSGLTVENVTVKDPPCFNFWLCNADHFKFSNIKFVNSSPASNYNNDGIHLNGYCTYGYITNIRGQTNDDFIALNADDSYFTGSSFDFGQGATGATIGPINNIVVDGMFMEGGISGLRIASTVSRIDQILIRNLSGTCQTQVILVDNMPSLSGSGSGAGNVGSVSIDGINTVVNFSNGFITPYYIDIRGNIENLTIRNLNRQNSTVPVGQTAYPTLWQESGTIQQLNISDLFLRDSDSTHDPTSHVKLNGTVTNLNLNGVSWLQTYAGTGFLLDGTGTLSNLVLSNVNAPARILGTLAPSVKKGDYFANYAASTTISSLSPASGAIGAALTIAGSGFTGATAVSFNGTNQPTFTVVSDSSITTTVPTGATSGNVSVTSPTGTATSFFTVGASSSFSDTFVRANGSQAGVNGWSLLEGTNPFTIASNILQLSDPVSSVYPAMTNSGVSAANVTVQATMNAAASNGVGIRFRATSTTTGYLIDYEVGSTINISCYKATGGGYVQIGAFASATITANADTVIKVVANGTSFAVYVGGTLITTYTDSTYAAAGLTGLRSGGGSGNVSRTVKAFSVTAP